MATIFYEKDTDPGVLADQRIAVLGYGSQGHAHAQNLKDSGLDVRVGLRTGSSSRPMAEEAGLRVLEIGDAVREADVVMVVLPDTSHGAVYAKEIAPNLKDGDMLMFAHGFSVHFGTVAPPAGVDVTMIAPKGPGHLVRRTYEQGIGTPALVAVQQDATGKARARALAYGSAHRRRARRHHRDHLQGGNRDRPVRRADGAVRRGLGSWSRNGFDTLVAAGYQPEIAYFECLHELKLIIDLIYEGGLSWDALLGCRTPRSGATTRAEPEGGRRPLACGLWNRSSTTIQDGSSPNDGSRKPTPASRSSSDFGSRRRRPSWSRWGGSYVR